jgi:hypothetical protein
VEVSGDRGKMHVRVVTLLIEVYVDPFVLILSNIVI